MTEIWCVYKTGGVYTREYVRRLYEGVKKHSGINLKVLSDDKGIATEFLRHDDVSGWWAKLELFRVAKGPTLYFDLDTVVHGDIVPLVREVHRHEMIMLQDFTVPKEFGSGLMGWRNDMSHIYEAFREDPIQISQRYVSRPFFGDQDFIRDNASVPIEKWQTHLPGLIGSYKVGHKGSAVTCYHGSPKPHETGWAH